MRWMLAAGAVLWAVWNCPGALAVEDPCRSVFVYYFPDTILQKADVIVHHYQAWMDEYAAPVIGRPLKLQYFTRYDRLVSYVEDCQKRGTWPLFGALHAEVAIERREAWQLELEAVAADSRGALTHQISVVTRRDRGARSLADLRGTTLIAPEYWSSDRGRFEKLVFDNQLTLDDFGRIELSPSSMSSAMGLIYRSADVALLSSRVFEVLRERMMPVWQRLVLVHQSVPIAIGMAVSFPGLDPATHKALHEAVLHAHETAPGKKWADATRMSHMVEATWDELDAILAADLATRAREAGP